MKFNYWTFNFIFYTDELIHKTASFLILFYHREIRLESSAQY